MRLLNELKRRFMQRDEAQLACVYVAAKVCALAVAERVEDEIKVRIAVERLASLDDLEDVLSRQLSALAEKLNRINVVLGPDFYTLSLLDRPEVDDDEINEALRWLLQENTEFDVADAAIDSFELPESARRGRDMRFAAVSPNEPLRAIVDNFRRAGLAVETIDIAALGLSSLVWNLYGSDDHGFAILRLSGELGAINVSRAGELYLSRRLSGVPEHFDAQSWERYRDHLLLQIQRSIDYYESTLNQVPCACLFVAAEDERLQPIVDYLGEMLPMPVKPLIPELLKKWGIELYTHEGHESLDEEASRGHVATLVEVLPVFGSVFRLEEAAVS